MNERNLIKISLIFSLIGIFCLYLIAETIDVPSSKIKDVDKDEFVKIRGIVDKVVDKEKVMFVSLIQPEEIEVVLFKEEFLDIQEGDYIEVTGMSEEYDGEIQIVGNVVEKIR